MFKEAFKHKNIVFRIHTKRENPNLKDSASRLQLSFVLLIGCWVIQTIDIMILFFNPKARKRELRVMPLRKLTEAGIRMEMRSVCVCVCVSGVCVRALICLLSCARLQ